MNTRMLSVLAAALAAFAASAQESNAIRCDFESEPAGANVLVDGILRGKTPLMLYDIGPGRHHVSFELQGYEGFDDFLVLRDGESVARSAVLKPVKGILLLITDPEGCDVSLDGISLGTTPRLVASLDAKGTYRMLLQKPGYQSRNIDVKFDGRVPLVRQEKLIIDSGIIDVTSEPAGASVSVNGQPRGFTPITVRNVPKGQATVIIEKKGYESAKRELSIVAGDTQTLFVKMDGIPGSMTLTSVPDGARFYVNGQPQGKGPLLMGRLKPGKYEVRAEKEGFAPVTKSVVLENGGSVSEEFRLQNIMGRLEVSTSPAGAEVWLDGTRVGITKIRANAPDGELSDVCAIENVLAGQHTLQIRCEGYSTATRHPTVETSKTKSVTVRMKRVFTPNVEIITDTGVYKGMLISNTPAGVEVEVALGAIRLFKPEEIRKLNFLK